VAAFFSGETQWVSARKVVLAVVVAWEARVAVVAVARRMVAREVAADAVTAVPEIRVIVRQ
jgi:hypothetical protein